VVIKLFTYWLWRQIAGLANIASNYLIAGQEALRHGTAHPSVVPYQVFPCKEGFLMIGAGNNKQVRDIKGQASA
jgi:succinate--hydroxymethylglutarate CoA-transferase